jgi:hypothetical protein
LIASMTSAVLLAALTMVGITSAAQAAPTDTTGATITWNIRDSWVNYINGPIAAGEIQTTGNATGSPANPFTWSGATGTVEEDPDAALTAAVAATGGVTFHGHMGHVVDGEWALDMTISDPQITIQGDTGTLNVHVRSSAALAFPDYDGRLDFATFPVTDATHADDTVTIPEAAVTLTDAAKPIFGGMYDADDNDDFGTITLTLPYPPTEPLATTTTVVAAPEARSPLGQAVALTATVTAAEGTDAPSGTVEFYSTPAGSDSAASLGTATVVDGVATLSTASLTAGGHTFTAVYTPEGLDFSSSSSEPTANYGVVDPSAPEPYEPGADAIVGESPATASWTWSAYASGWTKSAEGDITVEDGTFVLSNGVVTADAGGAVVQFSGTMRVAAYEGFFPPDGQWVELVDPALHLTADGSGVWVAGVNTGVAEYSADPDAERLVVGTFSGVSNVGPGTSGERTVAFDYAGTTALGTWSAAYSNAWPNQFVLAVPGAIQAFYYQSGESAANLTKPPADLTVDMTWPEPAPEPQPTPTDGFFLNDGWDSTADHVFRYGRTNDQVYVGDWDGDGADTLAVRRGNRYFFGNSLADGPADVVLDYGRATDQVLVGDWNGDGTDTLAVRRGNTYYLSNNLTSANADVVLDYGRATDLVLVGDWDGNGADTLGVRRGNAYFLNDALSGGRASQEFTYGRASDVVLVGDWDGDSRDTLAVRRGNAYFLANSFRSGSADRELTYGRATDEVFVGDWDGDGVDTLGVRRLPR